MTLSHGLSHYNNFFVTDPPVTKARLSVTILKIQPSLRFATCYFTKWLGNGGRTLASSCQGQGFVSSCRFWHWARENGEKGKIVLWHFQESNIYLSLSFFIFLYLSLSFFIFLYLSLSFFIFLYLSLSFSPFHPSFQSRSKSSFQNFYL